MNERDKRTGESEEEIFAELAELIGTDPAPGEDIAKRVERIAALLGQEPRSPG
jgi:hypothetical protein